MWKVCYKNTIRKFGFYHPKKSREYSGGKYYKKVCFYTPEKKLENMFGKILYKSREYSGAKTKDTDIHNVLHIWGGGTVSFATVRVCTFVPVPNLGPEGLQPILVEKCKYYEFVCFTSCFMCFAVPHTYYITHLYVKRSTFSHMERCCADDESTNFREIQKNKKFHFLK